MSLFIVLLATFTNLAYADGRNCDYAQLKQSGNTATTEDLLTASFQQSDCPELREAIFKNEKSDDIVKAVTPFLDKVEKPFFESLKELKGRNEDNAETKLMLERQKLIANLDGPLKTKCPVEKKDDACKAKARYLRFVSAIKEQLRVLLAEEAVASQKERDAQNPEKVFRMKFCKNPNLWGVLYVQPKPLESGCIYSLIGPKGRMYVIQSISGGILVGQPSSLLLPKVIVIKTRKQYADGDIIQDQFVKSVGLHKYTAVTGAQRTVNAFQYLGDGFNSDEAEESSEPQ